MPAPFVYGLALMVYRYLMPNAVRLVLIVLVLVAIPSFSSLNDGFKFMGFVVLPKRGTIRLKGLSFDCCSASCMLDYKVISFPLREAL